MLLEKKTGIHLYINVKNFSSIVKEEENNTSDLDHSLHALNIYFKSIERVCHNMNIDIEKVTGSRLHLFIEGDYCDESVIKKLYDISLFAINAPKKMDKIGKYQSIDKFKISLGACEGDCYYYTFTDYSTNFEEISSIGYSANVGSKLEGLSKTNSLAITFNLAKRFNEQYSKVKCLKGTSDLKKYDLNSYYLFDLTNEYVNLNHTLYNNIVDDANNLLLKDISFDSFKSSFKFENLSIKNCKYGNSIIVMADVRGSTKLYSKDGRNLEDMTFKTERLLREMYNSINENDGIHVQFQGDKEVALFMITKAKNALFAALQIQDNIKALGLKCGIAIHYGDIYASRVGIRNEKDNIILGENVLFSDKLEDEYANSDETVLSKEMYNFMKLDNKNQCVLKYFTLRDGVYKTNLGYKELIRKMSLDQSNENYNKGNYNGAWKKF